jgi:hypothetical protein
MSKIIDESKDSKEIIAAESMKLQAIKFKLEALDVGVDIAEVNRFIEQHKDSNNNNIMRELLLDVKFW